MQIYDAVDAASMVLIEPDPAPLDREQPSGSADEPTGDMLGDDDVVDTVLSCSRAIALLTGASIHQVTEDVTVAQYRALAVLGGRSEWRLTDLAKAMGVTPSTATRMCDRLVHKDLVSRERDGVDRREVLLALTSHGRELVDLVTEQVRYLVRGMLDAVPGAERARTVHAFVLLDQVLDRALRSSWGAERSLS